jgi:4-hydroxythreonine-4-phosphate dehydrogenase
VKPILITVGEPAGIGPDCILRAWQAEPDALRGCVISAPAGWLQSRAAMIGVEATVTGFDTLADAAAGHGGLRCWNPAAYLACEPVTPGAPSAQTAAAVVRCIEAAADASLNSRAAALVTGPIEKAVLRSAGFSFPGHTEFLAHLAAVAGRAPDADHFAMMLASDQIRVALLTTHLALRDVAGRINRADTLKLIRIVDLDLRRRFAISAPRLALCALNPHAGEQGHFGREEIDILAPAAAAAREQGINISDPLPADTVFSAAARAQYDAMVCCYHDQALIPLKALSFGNSVNVTLGLPFIRTSVDHGTALDLAARPGVSCSSLLAAIAMARRMSGS